MFKQILKALLIWAGLGCVSLALLYGGAMLHKQANQVEPVQPAAIACHGVWVGHKWIETRQSEEDIGALADKLKTHGIGCLYMHATPLQDDGSFDLTRGEYTDYFLTTFRHYYPAATIYAWLGIVSKDLEGDSIGYKFDLSEYQRIQNIEATAFELVDEYGFDGVHLDIEPLLSGDKDYLILLSGLHEGLKMRSKRLSVATMFLADEARKQRLAERNKPLLWAWETGYLADIARFVDQIVIMHYNLGVASEDDFMASLLWHMQEMRTIRGQEVAVIMGLPTYDFAYAEFENITSGLQGIKSAERQGLDIDGIAIYAEWTTDEAEWAQIKEYTCTGSICE